MASLFADAAVLPVALPALPLNRTMAVVRVASGFLVVALFLAGIAAVPVLGLVSLGYLLEVEGRLARGVAWRDAFPWLRHAPRAGAAVLLTWLSALPVRLLWDATLDARVIAPGGNAARFLLILTAAVGVAVTLNVVAAIVRGDTLSALIWLPGNVRWAWRRMRAMGSKRTVRLPERIESLWRELDLPSLFSLGLRGGVGAMLWLIAPTLVWALARGTPPRPALAICGGLMMLPILAWLPLLQTRFAAQRRLRALFELGAARQLFSRAPAAWFISLIVSYALTLPLFLLKVVLPPRDAAWLVTLLFVIMILPARLMLAWAYRRAMKHSGPASPWFVHPLKVALFGVLAAYALLLFLTPLVDTHGKSALLAYQAFLLPSPF